MLVLMLHTRGLTAARGERPVGSVVGAGHARPRPHTVDATLLSLLLAMAQTTRLWIWFHNKMNVVVLLV